MSEIANLRSSGLLDGFLSMYGASINKKMPIPGMVTPATIGWNMVSSSCRPKKYQGAFDGFGVWLKFAKSCSGAFTTHEKTVTKAVRNRAATSSTMSRCGHVWTLSCGFALTSWI